MPGDPLLSAVLEPHRRALLQLLAGGPQTVGALARHFPVSRPAISQHLRVLVDAGLVTEQRHGRERLYHLQGERLGDVQDWLTKYRGFWQARFAALGRFLDEQDGHDARGDEGL